MGCQDSKEKIENEMIKMKMERAEIRMERKNQLKLLKDIDGCDINLVQIPDYLALDENSGLETKRSKKNEEESINKIKGPKLKMRKSKSQKNNVYRKKSQKSLKKKTIKE